MVPVEAGALGLSCTVVFAPGLRELEADIRKTRKLVPLGVEALGVPDVVVFWGVWACINSQTTGGGQLGLRLTWHSSKANRKASRLT